MNENEQGTPLKDTLSLLIVRKEKNVITWKIYQCSNRLHNNQLVYNSDIYIKLPFDNVHKPYYILDNVNGNENTYVLKT